MSAEKTPAEFLEGTYKFSDYCEKMASFGRYQRYNFLKQLLDQLKQGPITEDVLKHIYLNEKTMT